MTKLTVEYLRQMAIPKSFERGEDIYDRDDVTNFSVNAGKVSAFVRGSRKYRVSIHENEKEFIFSCTCPYDYGGICKHCVAVGLELINKNLDLKLSGEVEKEKIDINVEELINKTSGTVLIEFLLEIFKENPVLIKRFEVFLKGQTKVEQNLDMQEIRDEIIGQLEVFDLNDYDRFYQSNDYNHYREGWGELYDGALDELDDLFLPYFQKAESYLNERNIIDSFKYYLTIYESICLFDDAKMDDEYEIFDCIKDELADLWKRNFEAFEIYLKSFSIKCDVVERILEIWLKSILMLEHEGYYNLFIFETFFINLISDNKKTANSVLKMLSANQLLSFDTVEVQLHCYEILEDINNWEAVALQHYIDKDAIADRLLDFYANRNDTEKYFEIAQIIFEKKTHIFDEKIYQYLKDKGDSLFFTKVLFSHTINKGDIKLVKEINDRYGSTGLDEFIQQLKELHYLGNFYVEVLEYKQDFAAILRYLQENIQYQEIDFAVRPIVNIYPDECFRLVKQKVINYLDINKGRKYYVIAVSWMKLLQEINDPQISHKVGLFLDAIRKKYKNRPALLDEMSWLSS